MTELVIDGIAGGGEGVARDDEGRVVFVRGALPGETVDATITEEKSSFARGTVRVVLNPSPHRVEPPCDHVADGCGGCDFQHAHADFQRDLKVTMVTDALERIGRIEAPVVHAAVPLDDHGYRTTVRCVVDNGRAAFRLRQSHEPMIVESCVTAHPDVEYLMTEGWYGETKEVTIRVGANTGDRLVVASPKAEGVELPEGVVLTSTNQLKRGTRVWFHEEVAGRRWRISARSFFQTSPQGAEALVAAVSDAARPFIDASTSLADLYSGVGLFAGTLPVSGKIVTVESSASAVADARVNLADRDVQAIRAKVEDWSPSPANLVVADPARKGLGKAAVTRIDQTGADTLVLVSCDAGALGRDAGLLSHRGFSLVSAQLVDLFPQTSHVEVVSVFRRS